MTQLPKKKHRQHHVWQHYLEPWATKGKLYCLRNGTIFHADTSNVAVERDFYKLQRLTKKDISFLRQFVIETGPAHSKRMHEDFLRRLLAPRTLVERHRHILPEAQPVDEFLETHETNVLEDHHMNIENSFAKILRQLQNRDTTFYANDHDCILFAWYIGTQYMRTKGIKERMIETFRQNMNIDISRLWDIASLILATNIGCSLFLGRKQQQLVLLDNRTEIEFITGDQPLINLHVGNRPQPPSKLSLYYPLSPRVAMIWSEVNEVVPYSSETLTPEEVARFNSRTMREAHSQVFAHSAAVLELLRAA